MKTAFESIVAVGATFFTFLFGAWDTPLVNTINENIVDEFKTSYRFKAIQAGIDGVIDIDTEEYDYINKLLAEDYNYVYTRIKRDK